MYSPGIVNFTLVDVFPSASAGSFTFSKETSPGPRNLLHVIPTRTGGGSSLNHNVRASGSESFVVSIRAIPCGGPVNDGPFDSNRTTGGVLPLPASLKGSTTQSGFKLIGMDVS